MTSTEQAGWATPSVPPEPGQAEAFGALAEAVRDLQVRYSGSRPPAQASARAERLVRQAAAVLAEHPADEWQQLAGKLESGASAGRLLTPPITYLEDGPDLAVATVRFSRFYLGANGAAHGGAVPLVYDDVMGRMSGAGDRPRARTAYLHVNFRSITPIDKDLRVVIRVEKSEGRKLFISGTMHDGETLVSDAEGLWVQLRPDQP